MSSAEKEISSPEKQASIPEELYDDDKIVPLPAELDGNEYISFQLSRSRSRKQSESANWKLATPLNERYSIAEMQVFERQQKDMEEQSRSRKKMLVEMQMLTDAITSGDDLHDNGDMKSSNQNFRKVTPDLTT